MYTETLLDLGLRDFEVEKFAGHRSMRKDMPDLEYIFRPSSKYLLSDEDGLMVWFEKYYLNNNDLAKICSNFIHYINSKSDEDYYISSTLEDIESSHGPMISSIRSKNHEVAYWISTLENLDKKIWGVILIESRDYPNMIDFEEFIERNKTKSN